MTEPMTPDAQPTQAPDGLREAVRAILAELPMGDDGTGHIADCGYDEDRAPCCGCMSLPGRIADVLRRFPAPSEPEATGPAERLCSQCGELMAAMVKVGTEDGWCTRCLDEAAGLDHEPHPPAEGEMDRADAIRARLDGMDTVLPKTADDLRWLLAERDALAAKVARVEELAEDWASWSPSPWDEPASELRAALEGGEA